jgi:hypothetical protein
VSDLSQKPKRTSLVIIRKEVPVRLPVLRTSKCARLSECARLRGTSDVGNMSSDQLARANNTCVAQTSVHSSMIPASLKYYFSMKKDHALL